MSIKEYSGGKKGTGIYIVTILLLMGGIILGSVYLAGRDNETLDGIKNYIADLFASFAEGTDNILVFKNSFIRNTLEALFIFFMGFFRMGCIGTGLLLVRKGFVTGFTAASFFKLYGAKGIWVMLASMPATIITIPVLMFYSVISVRFSLKEQKKSIFFYIFFLFFIISIFCVSSLSEGFLTTTFMKWISLN